MANLKITYWALDRLRHFDGNARHHSEKQLLEIARSIQRFGFVNPVLVDTSGEIIAGHGRALAADKLMLEKVPVIVLADLSENEKRALRLADNRIAENSTWDQSLLRSELQSLQHLEVDTEGLGWDADELDHLMAEVSGILPDNPLEPTSSTREQPQPNDGNEEEEGEELEEQPAPAPAPEPKASDDDYSVFELVMVHENKIRLIECLSKIRAENLYEKLEDALMHLVREHEGDPIA